MSTKRKCHQYSNLTPLTEETKVAMRNQEHSSVSVIIEPDDGDQSTMARPRKHERTPSPPLMARRESPFEGVSATGRSRSGSTSSSGSGSAPNQAMTPPKLWLIPNDDERPAAAVPVALTRPTLSVNDKVKDRCVKPQGGRIYGTLRQTALYHPLCFQQNVRPKALAPLPVHGQDFESSKSCHEPRKRPVLSCPDEARKRQRCLLKRMSPDPWQSAKKDEKLEQEEELLTAPHLQSSGQYLWKPTLYRFHTRAAPVSQNGECPPIMHFNHYSGGKRVLPDPEKNAFVARKDEDPREDEVKLTCDEEVGTSAAATDDERETYETALILSSQFSSNRSVLRL